jgi:hypothetical protein
MADEQKSEQPPKPQACLWCGVAKNDARAKRPCFYTNDKHQFVPVTVF